MIRRPPRSTLDRSSAASDVYKRQGSVFIDGVEYDDSNASVAQDDGAGESVNAELKLGCLLYTSPSPRDRTRSRMPSSA